MEENNGADVKYAFLAKIFHGFWLVLLQFISKEYLLNLSIAGTNLQ
jgi:hypothetical protein